MGPQDQQDQQPAPPLTPPAATSLPGLPEAQNVIAPPPPAAPEAPAASGGYVPPTEQEYQQLLADNEVLKEYAQKKYEEEQAELQRRRAEPPGGATAPRGKFAAFDDEPPVAAYKPHERESALALVRASLKELGIDIDAVRALPSQVGALAQHSAAVAYDRDRAAAQVKYGASVVDARHSRVEALMKERRAQGRALSYEDAYLIVKGQDDHRQATQPQPRPPQQPAPQPPRDLTQHSFNGPDSRAQPSPAPAAPVVPPEIRGNPRDVLMFLHGKA